MLEQQKITTHVPKYLISEAQKATGKGITDTVKEALELLLAKDASSKLRDLRGKLSFSIDIKELRKDNDCR